jgi:hypothetical protein
MKIIDNNGRLFGKISIIDVFVILVVAVMAVALYLKTNTMTHTSTAVSNDIIEYQILVQGVSPYVEENLRVGDKLFDEDNGSVGSLGEITAFEILPGTEQVSFRDGTVDVVPTEDTVGILISVRGEGLIQNKSYFLNRVYSLGVNSARNFCTTYVRMTGTVVSIG